MALSGDTVGVLVGIASLGAIVVGCTKYIVGSVGEMATSIVGVKGEVGALRRDVDRHEEIIEKLREPHPYREAHGGAE